LLTFQREMPVKDREGNNNMDLRHEATNRSQADQRRFGDRAQWVTSGRRGAWYYQGKHRCQSGVYYKLENCHSLIYADSLWVFLSDM